MAEGFKGNYAPELFNELKRYYLLQAQEKTSLTDAELRDLNELSNTFTRRFIQNEVGDSAIDDSFKIVQHPTDNVNNFSITGGEGTLDDPGVLFLKGFRLSLRNDIAYKDQTNNGDIESDAYTKTILPALTTPTGTSSTLNAITRSSNGVLVAVGNGGIVLKSTDNGKNFVPKTGVSDNFYAVGFSDSTNVYAVGYTGGSGRILYSTDSGETWNDHPTSGASWKGISFVNTSLGYAVGVAGKLYVGSGNSWGSDPTGDLLVPQNLNAVSTYNNANIWAVGNSGVIIKYDGAGWSQQSSDTTLNLNGVFAVSSSTVLACGESGIIQKTTNSGTAWSTRNSDTTENLNGIFLNGTKGWAVGNKGVVSHTEDTGITWDSTIIDASFDFKSVLFSDTTGFIVGSNGVIYRTVDGINWERYRTDYVYVDFHLAEVSADQSSEYTDSTLIDPVVGSPSANRLRIVQDVKVSEGWPTPSDYTYTGSDGTVQQHYTHALAKIQRFVGVSSISQADITDLRTVNLTVAELNDLLHNGGIDSAALAAGAVTPEKLDSGADYTFGSAHILGNTLVGGDLTIEGVIHVDATMRTSIIVESLGVFGSSQLGDSTKPYDDTAEIFGQIIQNNDVNAPSYSIHSHSTTLTSPVISILQDGFGPALKIQKTSDSTLCLIDVTSAGKGYDICVTHLGTSGGILKSWDDSTGDSIQITKDATKSTGSILSLVSNAYGPVIKINNQALCPSVSVEIDQSSGTALNILAKNDASSIVIHSTGSGTDLKIQHDSLTGVAVDMTSSGTAAVRINNVKGQAGVITQKDNQNLFTLTKTGNGSGRVIEVNNYGIDPAIQINTDGSAISLHVSHTGDSTAPAVDIYVAGNEKGPALKITKANNDSTDDVGQAVYIWNRGFSQSIQILQDHTDSTAATIELRNLSLGDDASSINWRIDRNGNFITNGGKFFFDRTHYVSSESFYIDKNNFDSSNPAIAGKVFDESGYLRVSDGTKAMPSPLGGGVTGLQGLTGLSGTGATGISGGGTGLQGMVGETGVKGDIGDPGPSGETGLKGIQGDTGVQGHTGLGIQGDTGVQGETGLGETGIQGETGFGIQGETGQTGILGETGQTGIRGPTGFCGQTGIRGVTGVTGRTGVQGVTGIYAQTGIQGVTGLVGETGVQGVTGFYGETGIGETGIQGLTGIAGLTGLALGSTGFYGQTGIQGLTGPGVGDQGGTGIIGPTGIQGMTGLGPAGETGLQGMTGIYAPDAIVGAGLTGTSWKRTTGYLPVFTDSTTVADSLVNQVIGCGDKRVLADALIIASAGFEVDTVQWLDRVADTTVISYLNTNDYRRSFYINPDYLDSSNPATAGNIFHDTEGYLRYSSGTTPLSDAFSRLDNLEPGIPYPLSVFSGEKTITDSFIQQETFCGTVLQSVNVDAQITALGGLKIDSTEWLDGVPDTTAISYLNSFDHRRSFYINPDYLDSSNPATAGNIFHDTEGYLRYSSGTTPLSENVQGATGVQGNTGIGGVTGIYGKTGIQGVTGLQGQTGFQGGTGIKGGTGVQGVTGLVGGTGIQGVTGLIGGTGIQGVTGLVGGTGIQGGTGLIGETGIQGGTGFCGQTGIQGVTGFYGSTGVQGYTGAQNFVTGTENYLAMFSDGTSSLIDSLFGRYSSGDTTEWNICTGGTDPLRIQTTKLVVSPYNTDSTNLSVDTANKKVYVNGRFLVFDSGVYDDYPLLAINNVVNSYSHDDIALNFDSWWNYGWYSSDAGSNFRIYKKGDALRFSYANGVDPGTTIDAWSSEDSSVALSLTSTGATVVGGSLALPYKEITTDFTCLDYTCTDLDFTIRFNDTSGEDFSPPINIVLPTAASCPGRIYVFSGTGGSEGDIYRLVPSGGDIINGDATWGLETYNYGTPHDINTWTVQSNGVTEWIMLSIYHFSDA